MPKTIKRKIDKNNSRKKGDELLHKNLDLPSEVALYYGFTLAEPPLVNKDDVKKAKSINENDSDNKQLEERVALVRYYHEQNMQNLPQPVMLYFGKPISTQGSKKVQSKERVISLEVIGTPKSVAEAILIKTTFEILKDEGFENLCIHINSIGEKDNLSRFGKELSNFYRKNIEELPAHCKQQMRRDIFDLLVCKNEKCVSIRTNAPKSMNFLSESSRQHFKEVLEYLEILDVPYEIDHCLVGNRSFASQTLFEIFGCEKNADPALLATGVRYANIAKKIGYKKDVPGIGVTMKFKEKNNSKNLKFQKPKIYFIQLGFEAKLKSLKIIEILRQAKIPTHQSISRDKLISQLGTAENMKVPYTIIMGQKEALENTMIVRNMSDRSQESVKIEDLPNYLKKLF